MKNNEYNNTNPSLQYTYYMRNATDNMYEVLMAPWKLVHSLGNTAMRLYKDTCSQSCTQQIGSRSSAFLFPYLHPDCLSMACIWCSPISTSDGPAHDSLWSAPLSFIPSTKRTSTLFPQGPMKSFYSVPQSLFVGYNLPFISVQRISLNDVAHILYKWGNITIQAMIWWPQILASEQTSPQQHNKAKESLSQL